MKNIYYILILSFSLLLACKRDSEKLTQIGPAYVTTEEAFSISSDPADFTTGGHVNFKAKLTTHTPWTIEVKGLYSEAIKRFSDTSEVIDLSNTQWDGSSDTTMKFRSEPCVAKLYLPVSKVTKTIRFNSFIGPFSITTPLAISTNPVDFGVPVSFTGELNRVKSWVITIKGNTSGAIKRISGFDKSLSASNTTWDGSSDTTFFFRAEACQAILSFPDTSLTQTIDFTISQPKTHSGYLINDFEAAVFGTYLGNYTGNYFDAADQASSTIDLFAFSPAPEGSKVLRFDCKDVNSSYYTGGAYHNSVASSFGMPSMSADSLYMNLFIYGYANGNAALSIEVKESDGNSWAPAQINVNWIGWKLVSLQFSKMTGTGTRESSKINAVNISMNSIPQGQNCRALVDYLIFTQGAPLKP